MEFKKTVLSNGLTIIGEINKSAKSASVGFFVKTGSRDETDRINGVSHFLEHMLFKGTKKLSSFEVNEAFDRTGAKFNAFTSEENTVYFAAVLPEYLIEVTKLWIELMRPALRDEDFNMEKNVIKEEIAMYQDQPSFDVIDRCRKLYFDSHPCGNSVLGSKESIDALKAEQMRSYFEKRYAPDNIVLACAGNFDWNQLCSTAQQLCVGWQKQNVTRQMKDHQPVNKKERIEKANLTREHICLMSRSVSAQDDKRFAASILSTIVGDDFGSRYYWELVDNALAESASMNYSAMDGTGVFCSYINCSSENTTKVFDGLRQIFNSLCEKGITADELRKAKNKISSAFVIKNEIPMGRLMNLGSNWIYLQKYLTVEDEISSIKSVTIDEVNSLIEQLKPGQFTQLLLGPAKKCRNGNW